jgi:hypothetical protein
MRRVIIHTLVILLILLLGFSPIISALIAGTIFVNPCIINGEDWGQDLYTFGVLGWLAIGTIPISLGAVAVYIVVVIIIAVIQATRRRKAEAQAQTPLPPN